MHKWVIFYIPRRLVLWNQQCFIDMPWTMDQLYWNCVNSQEAQDVNNCVILFHNVRIWDSYRLLVTNGIKMGLKVTSGSCKLLKLMIANGISKLSYLYGISKVSSPPYRRWETEFLHETFWSKAFANVKKTNQ